MKIVTYILYGDVDRTIFFGKVTSNQAANPWMEVLPKQEKRKSFWKSWNEKTHILNTFTYQFKENDVTLHSIFFYFELRSCNIQTRKRDIKQKTCTGKSELYLYTGDSNNLKLNNPKDTSNGIK